MTDFCRFCAEQLSLLKWSECLKVSHRYLYMYESLEDYIDINDKLLPKTACEACFNAFKVTKAFYNNVKQSQIVLKDLYKQKELPLLVKGENECDAVSNEIYVDNSLEQQETQPTDVISSPLCTQNVNLCTDYTTLRNNAQLTKDCFVLLHKLELSPTGFFDSSVHNERKDCVNHERNEGMSEDNVTSNINYENNGCQITRDYANGTLAVKEEHDSDTDTPMDLRESNPDYIENKNESLIVSKTIYFESTDRKVDANLMKVKRDVSIRPTNNSWTDYKWSCSHCESGFEDLSELRTHSKQAHIICYAFKCMDCNEQYDVFDSFIEHIRQHRESLRNYCQFCNNRFHDTNDLKKHVAKHLSGPKTPCNSCGQIFDNRSLLLQHAMKYKPPQHVDKDRTCKVGGKTLGDMPQSQHRRLLKEDKIVKLHKCNICSNTYKSTIHAHMKRHHLTLSKPTISKLFICDYCEKQYSRKYILRNHIILKHSPWNNEHQVDCCKTKQNGFICNFCGTKFENREDIVKHIMKHETSRNLTCYICCKSFYHCYVFKKHMESHDVDKEVEFTCSVCSKSFYNPSNLKKHMKTHDVNRKRTFTCNTCSKSFYCLPELKKHEKIHDTNRKKAFPCEICGKSYFFSYKLKNHMEVHDVTKKIDNFICKVCNKSYSCPYTFKNHVEIHNKDRKIASTCNICNKSFYCPYNMKKHILSHDVNRKRTFTCNTCSKSFYCLPELKKHEKIHDASRKKAFSCEICGKSYFFSYKLKKHMEVHDVTKKIDNFICKVCNKSYSCPYTFKNHMKIHNKDRKKEFTCDVCSKSFYCPYNMKKHKLSHDVNRKRPFTCNVCSKSFDYSYQLKTHMESHNVKRKRAFPCKICNKSFHYSYNLKAHMKVHDVNRRKGKVTCSVCSKSFYQTGSLNRHMKSHEKSICSQDPI